jgi:hypothetical protein
MPMVAEFSMRRSSFDPRPAKWDLWWGSGTGTGFLLLLQLFWVSIKWYWDRFAVTAVVILCLYQLVLGQVCCYCCGYSVSVSIGTGTGLLLLLRLFCVSLNWYWHGFAVTAAVILCQYQLVLGQVCCYCCGYSVSVSIGTGTGLPLLLRLFCVRIIWYWDRFAVTAAVILCQYQLVLGQVCCDCCDYSLSVSIVTGTGFLLLLRLFSVSINWYWDRFPLTAAVILCQYQFIYCLGNIIFVMDCFSKDISSELIIYIIIAFLLNKY